MPSVSEAQRSLWCMAQAIKESKMKPSYSKKAAEIAANNSLETIKHYCEEPVQKA